MRSVALLLPLVLAACGTTTKTTRDFGVGTERWVAVGAPMLTTVRNTSNWDGTPVGSFEQSLVYGGRQGGTIWIDYRELAGGYARPGFSQRTAHELGGNNEVVLHGVRFKIVEADAKGIRFKILSVSEQTRVDYAEGQPVEPAPEKPKATNPRYP